MSDRTPRLTDTGIERALARRAPHGGDPMLVAAIVGAAEATPQRRRTWWSFGPAHGRRTALVWIGVAVALAIAVGAFLVAGGQRHDRPNLAVVVAPSPTAAPTAAPAPASPSAVPSTAPESPSPTSADACATDDMTILTGAAMPADDGPPANPAGDAATGVFETQNIHTADGAVELWSIAPTSTAAERIAVVGGPTLDNVTVVDLTADGKVALVAAVSISAQGSFCVDLLSIQRDGSGSTLLDQFESIDAVAPVAMSHDGMRIAYVRLRSGTDAGQEPFVFTTTSIADRSSISQPTPCGYAGDGRLLWAPDDHHVAVGCSGGYVIVDPDGMAPTVSITTLGRMPADPVVWDELDQLRFVATTDLAVDLFSADSTTGATTRIRRLLGPDPSGEPYVRSTASSNLDRIAVSCCGRPFPRHDAPTRMIVLDNSGRTIPEALLGPDETWALAGDQAAIDVRPEASGFFYDLVRFDPRTRAVTILGRLPSDYKGGIWRIP